MGEWREVDAMKKGVSLISQDLQRKTRRAILFVTRRTGVTVAKVEVKRNEASGFGSWAFSKICIFKKIGAQELLFYLWSVTIKLIICSSND